MDRTKVYYDAECKICQVSANILNDTTGGSQYELVNVHTAELPAGFDRTTMLKEIYVTTPSGKTYKNADAILHILKSYWYLRPLIWIGELPGFIHILRFMYGVLSRNRHRFFKNRT